MKDLFEHYEKLPTEINVIIEKYSLMDQNYPNCAKFQKELNQLGYDFEWGLDAEPFNLRKLNYIMTKEQNIEFSKWLNSDNVAFHSNNVYLEQTTQYKKRFTLKELRLFYMKEYMVD